MKIIYFLAIYFLSFIVANGQAVTTISGLAGVAGSSNGAALSARFNEPYGITADKNGNIFIADRLNNVIRKISPSGIVTTLAGSGIAGGTDGLGAAASFNEPWAIANDTLGNLYVADTKSYKIRKIDASGNVTTVAGTGVFGTTNGPANISRFGFSSGIAVNKAGSIIYVADYNTHVIRKIEAGVVSNLAGIVYIVGSNNGAGATATFNHPHSIEIDNSGNLIVSDSWNNTLRKITPSGIVSTFAGNGLIGGVDGNVSISSFNYPWDIATDTLGNIFVLDGYNFTVRKINSANQVSTYVGSPLQLGSVDGIGSAARFNNAAGIVYNPANKSLYVADTKNHTIRKISNTSSVSINLTVNGGSTICSGDSIKLTATPTNLSSYSILENGNIVGTSNSSNITIAPLSSGNHTLICNAFDSNGAIATSNTIVITVLPSFTPGITSSNGNTICLGDSVLLTAQSGISYLWSTGATMQSIYIKTGGTYTCTVTNASGCRGESVAFTLSVSSPPTATIQTSSTNVCPGDSITLTASTGSSWLWSNGQTSNSILVPAGTYNVTVTGANGCKAKSSNVTITNYSVTTPVISPSGIITIFSGDSTQLTASGNGTFLWSNGQSGNSTYVSTAGNYNVTLINANGCEVTSIPVSVNVINGNSIISLSGASTFCYGNNVVLTSVFTTGNQWYFNNLPLVGETNQTLNVTDSGYYYVAVWQSGNWINSDSILITVLPTPQYPSVNDTSVCKGTSLTLNAIGNDQYSWYADQTGGQKISTTSSLFISSFDNPTTYYVEATNSYGCTTIGRLDVNVGLLPSPQISFTPSTQVASGIFTTTFINNTVNATSYFWIFGDTSQTGNTSTDPQPIHVYPGSGNYIVSLIAINTANGCADTLNRTINVSGNNAMFVPTTFTPNGDGKNDIFRVRGDRFIVQEMQIFDQWGTLIYRTDASKPTWDGKVNGTTTQNGTYVYKIRLENDDQVISELTGSITVIK